MARCGRLCRTGKAFENFEIFQYRKDIAWGQQWQERINAAIGTQINNYGPQVPIEVVLQLLKDNKPQSAPTAKTEPPTVVVDAWHRGDYMTITEAIKAAKPGTRIIVQPGLYKEGIIIDKPVEIIGNGKQGEIVIEAFGENAVLFQADNGRVANLTLRQTYGEWYHIDWCCVDITQGRLVLEGCDISSQSSMCVMIHSSANPRLYRNRIHDGEYNGVVVCKNGKGTLEDNEIFANKFSGVTIMTGGTSMLHRNRIYQNGLEGVRVLSGGGGIFKNNDLRGNTKGAWLIEPDCESRMQRRGNLE